MSHTQQICCARVWPKGWTRSAECNKPAKVTVDDKHYCGLHNPIAIAEKQAKRDAQWAEERKEAEKAKAARLEAARRAECFPDLLAALKLAFQALDAIGEEMTVGERYTNAGQYLIDSLNPARAAIKKAEGQS